MTLTQGHKNSCLVYAGLTFCLRVKYLPCMHYRGYLLKKGSSLFEINGEGHDLWTFFSIMHLHISRQTCRQVFVTAAL